MQAQAWDASRGSMFSISWGASESDIHRGLYGKCVPTHVHTAPRCSHASIHTRMRAHTAVKPIALLCPLLLPLPQALSLMSVEGGQGSVHTESSPEG